MKIETLKDVWVRGIVGAGSAALLALGGCDRGGGAGAEGAHAGHDHAGETHNHGDDDAGHDHGEGGQMLDDDSDHDHAKDVALGDLVLGDVTLRVTQGHGAAEAGKELHLVLEAGSEGIAAGAIARVWVGTEDRLASMVALAEHDAGGHRFDAHAMVPDPMPEGAAWWIELELPDGTTRTGSIALH